MGAAAVPAMVRGPRAARVPHILTTVPAATARLAEVGMVTSWTIHTTPRSDVQAWAENSHRNQPLHAAIAGRCEFSVVTALIDARANVNAKDGGGFTPLHLAAFRGDPYVTETLLACGADVRLRTDSRKTALDLADEGGHVEVARRLRGEES